MKRKFPKDKRTRRAELSSTRWLNNSPGASIFNHMVDYDEQLDSIFRALADPTRRAMLRRLAAGEQGVGELAEPFEMSLAAASKHIKVLENAGLVRRTINGRSHRCRLEADTMQQATEWLRYYEQFWSERLDVLETLLKAPPKKGAKSGRQQKGKRSK